MRILIAPNAFKESLDATAVAEAIGLGLRKSDLKCTVSELPIADGGDGSLHVISQYLGAQMLEMEVNGPMGWHVQAKYGWEPGKKIGIVELAEASGIRHLHTDQLDPWNATTTGTGQLIRALVERGAKTIYLTVGGSATIDGGVGLLSELGVRFDHQSGQITQPMTSDLHKITHINATNALDLLADIRIIILCDVENPLLGAHGAATVFGPQKGASEKDVEQLEADLSNLAQVIAHDFGKSVGDMKHAGAAGGVSGALHGVLNAALVNGGEQILEWAGFDEELESADVVITGEGRIDSQTAYGKGPGLVARRAQNAGKYVIGLCGAVSPEVMVYEHFDVVLPVTSEPGSLHEVFQNTERNLERTAFMLGQMLKNFR